MIKQSIIVKAWDSTSNLDNKEALFLSNIISSMPDEDIADYDHNLDSVLEAIGLSEQDQDEACDIINTILSNHMEHPLSKQIELIEEEISKSYVIRRFLILTFMKLMKK